MKKITHFFITMFCLVIFVLVISDADAQQDSAISTKNLPNFLFPDFTKCVIKLKSGQMNSAVINYNILDQEMVFQQGDTYMVLDDPQSIDTIFVNNRRFVPFKTGFYELVLKGPVIFYIQHKAEAEPLGTPTAYGIRSQSASAVYHKKFYGAGRTTDLSIPDNFKITDMTEYWAEKAGSMENFRNKRQFLKIFKDKGKELSQFIDKNNINFKNLTDIIKLFNYCNVIYS